MGSKVLLENALYTAHRNYYNNKAIAKLTLTHINNNNYNDKILRKPPVKVNCDKNQSAQSHTLPVH